MRWNGDLGDGWQHDPADPDCGISSPVIYHQGSDECEIADEEWTSWSVRVECTCGEVYEAVRDQR